MKVVAGLGNPGRTYEGTRHNVGFDVVLELARVGPVLDRGGGSDLAWVRVRLPVHAPRAVPPRPALPDGSTDEASIVAWRAAKKVASQATEEQDVLLATPLAFMNRSGPPLLTLLAEHGVRPEQDLLVVVDDVDLEPGRLRLRREGSSGGQRGLESIELALGSPRYARLRLGVGRNPPGVPSEDWVLARPSRDESAGIRAGVERAAQAVRTWLARGIERAMDETNRNQNDPARDAPGPETS